MKLINEVYHSYNRHQNPFVAISIFMDKGWLFCMVAAVEQLSLIVSAWYIMWLYKLFEVQIWKGRQKKCNQRQQTQPVFWQNTFRDCRKAKIVNKKVGQISNLFPFQPLDGTEWQCWWMLMRYENCAGRKPSVIENETTAQLHIIWEAVHPSPVGCSSCSHFGFFFLKLLAL